MSDRGLPDLESLQIISDPETTDTETKSESCSSEDEYDTEGICFLCSTDLDYEENEYYDSDTDRFYCKRCYEQIFTLESEFEPKQVPETNSEPETPCDHVKKVCFVSIGSE